MTHSGIVGQTVAQNQKPMYSMVCMRIVRAESGEVRDDRGMRLAHEAG